MMAALWIVTAIALLLWSALAAGLWALLSIDPAWVAELHTRMADTKLGDLLDVWLGGWDEWLAWAIELSQGLLRSLQGWLVWILGAVWGLGTLVVLGITGLLHLAIRESQPKPLSS
ncbi:MAG: hypothetical protein CFE46_06315 [Burkholderiales bacterium PBB6]|nr:MAG: hypothetical protein CFE46_06315 [Burkholderiales bacterium PBB6]